MNRFMMLVLCAAAALSANAAKVVSSTAGGWVSVDTRSVKDTTREGDVITGGETSIVLQSSPNAWGESGGGSSATITWESTSGNSGTIAAATTADEVAWTPEARFGTNTLTYTSGAVTKTARFWVTCLQPEAPTIEPASGTTFDSELTINIRPITGATIHYTTDGTTPTVDSPVYKRFKIYGRTTVKAVAISSDGLASEVATAEYAMGNLATPVISPASGTFQHSDYEVSIAREGTDGTLRYTLDGTEPTAASPVYDGPFTVSETTTVKAKIFGDQFFNSGTATATLTREWLTVATPVIDAAATFTGSKTTVSISCATDGATIRYTTNGSDPNSHSPVYTGPFDVAASCTVKAQAFKSDYTASAVSTKTITKVCGIGDALNDPDRMFTTDNGTGWVRDTAVSKDGVESMRSGAIGDAAQYGAYSTSTMATVVSGKGTVSFWWKASCEDDATWDHGEFRADGQVWKIYGETDWRQVTYTFDTDGDHEISWVYCKDDFDSAGEDCIWVDMFSWVPALAPQPTATQTTEVPVPYAWLETYYPGTTDYEARAKQKAANGVNTVEEAYVAGLSPTNAASVFQAIVELVDGEVRISWRPDLNASSVTRIYTVYGRTKLEEGEWETPVRPWHRFFKVAVAMPTGAAGEKTAVAGEGFVPQDGPGGVQLWEGGPYWAECNVGASKPEEYGYYFWWGDTVGYTREGGTWNSSYSRYDGVTWKSSTGASMSSSPFAYTTCPTYEKSNSQLKSAGYIDSSGNLVAAHDAATAHLGAPWRMPTAVEWDALIDNCTTAWTNNYNNTGVNGRLVTGKGAYSSRSIFLPAAGLGLGSYLYDPGSDGNYWSSTPSSGNSYDAWYLRFDSGFFYRSDYVRDYGRSVRPVRGFAQ